MHSCTIYHDRNEFIYLGSIIAEYGNTVKIIKVMYLPEVEEVIVR